MSEILLPIDGLTYSSPSINLLKRMSHFNKGFTLFYKTAIMNAVTINNIIQKGGGRMVQDMSDKELITVTIDRYTDLQQIKKANGSHENEILDYLIKVTTAKLSSLGVNVEDITL